MSTAQEKVLVALTVYCFTEALRLLFKDLLPPAENLLSGFLSL